MRRTRLFVLGTVVLLLVCLTAACGQSSPWRPRATSTPNPPLSRPRATSTPNPSHRSIADCTEYVVDKVLWDDAPAYILVCISEGLGDRGECTRTVRETLSEVARDWCIENR